MDIKHIQKTCNSFFEQTLYTFIGEKQANGEIRYYNGFITRKLNETSYIVTIFDVFQKREIAIVSECIVDLDISDSKKIPEKEARVIFESWRLGR